MSAILTNIQVSVLLLNRIVYFFWYMTPYHWYGYVIESSQHKICNIQSKTQVFQLIDMKEVSSHMYYFLFQSKPVTCC